LVRKGLIYLLEKIAQLEGLQELVLTTNASTLEQYARPLKEAGVSRINISLDSLKEKRFQDITRVGDLSSVRPQNQMKYSTIVKNRALWNISASQDFIAEVESHRIVFELIDNNPQHIKAINKSDSFDDEGFTIEGWDPDY